MALSALLVLFTLEKSELGLFTANGDWKALVSSIILLDPFSSLISEEALILGETEGDLYGENGILTGPTISSASLELFSALRSAKGRDDLGGEWILSVRKLLSVGQKDVGCRGELPF